MCIFDTITTLDQKYLIGTTNKGNLIAWNIKNAIE
jgi:hypothetical protein